LLLFYTGNPHDSKEIFKEQNNNLKTKTIIFDSLVSYTNQALEYLQNEEYDKFGSFLDECWQIKKQFASGVSNAAIDDMYLKALNAGALGGKILGAGGGGFLLLYVKEADQLKVKAALKDYLEIKFNTSDSGSQIVYED